MQDKKPLANDWLGQEKGEDRKRTEEIVRNNVFLIGRLREILEARQKSLDGLELSKEAYDTPNWAFKQAHLNGMRQAYKDLMKLTDFLT